MCIYINIYIYLLLFNIIEYRIKKPTCKDKKEWKNEKQRD